MLLQDESLILRENVDNNFSVIIEKIVMLFDSMEYTAYQDELTEMINDQLQSKEILKESLYNLFYFHIYRVGLMLGLEFSIEGMLSDRYFILKSLSSINNLEPVIMESLVDYLSVDESNLEKLELILNDILEVEVDVYESIDTVNDELIDTLQTIMSDSKYNEIDIISEINIFRKKKQYNEIVNSEPNNHVLKFVENTDNPASIELILILFGEQLNSSNFDFIENLILTMIVFSTTDRQDYVETYVTQFSTILSTTTLALLDTRITEKLNKF